MRNNLLWYTQKISSKINYLVPTEVLNSFGPFSIENASGYSCPGQTWI